MNKNLFASAAALLAVLLLAGCEAERSKIPTVVFRNEVRAVPSERPLTEAEILARAVLQPPAPIGAKDWQMLFDGESLNGWRVADFPGHGPVECRKGLILLRAGEPFTGIQWTNDTPNVNYEITLEAMRVAGSGSFCELTFPAGGSFCSLIVGGWGGSVVGLSDLDGVDASENETTQVISFEDGRWYRIRLRVTEQKIEAWIEQKNVVDVTITGRKVSPRPGITELFRPLGIASQKTTAAFREIKIRRVAPSDPSDRDSDK